MGGKERRGLERDTRTVRLMEPVYSKFRKWSDAGVFQKIFDALNLDADMQDLSLDSSCVKAHQASAGAKKGL